MQQQPNRSAVEGAQHSLFQRKALAAALAVCFVPAVNATTINVAPNEVAVLDNDLCSLREAISNAETDSQADNDDCPAGNLDDTIVLPEDGDFVLSDELPGYNAGLPAVNSELTITGNGSTIRRFTDVCSFNGTDDASEFRHFFVGPSADFTLQDMTLRDGCVDDRNDGGSISLSSGELTVRNVRFLNNRADDKSGAIDTAGDSTVTVEDSSFIGNFGRRGGGAIGHGRGMNSFHLIRSLVADNASDQTGGGGIGNFGALYVENSTISGNSTGTSGGGIGNQGLLEVVNSTIVGNSSAPGAGGGVGSDGEFIVKNSIIADNGSGQDCLNLGLFDGEGNNLDSDGSCVAEDMADFTQSSVASLELGPLTNNGGLTYTHAIGINSVAFDAVSDCTDLDSANLLEDQRGSSRPAFNACDVGAFELHPAAPVPSLNFLGLGLLTGLMGMLGFYRRQRTAKS